MNKEEGKKEFGLKLKRLRTEKGISQEELAKALGYTNRSSINKIEIGRSAIPVDKISRIAQVLEVSPLELFDNAAEATDYIDTRTGTVIEMNKLSEPNRARLLAYYQALMDSQEE